MLQLEIFEIHFFKLWNKDYSYTKKNKNKQKVESQQINQLDAAVGIFEIHFFSVIWHKNDTQKRNKPLNSGEYHDQYYTCTTHKQTVNPDSFKSIITIEIISFVLWRSRKASVEWQKQFVHQYLINTKPKYTHTYMTLQWLIKILRQWINQKLYIEPKFINSTRTKKQKRQSRCKAKGFFLNKSYV